MKKIISFFVVVVLVFSLSVPAFAASVTQSEDLYIKQQVTALISAVDEVQLKNDALANVIDYSVPAEIRNSVAAQASFQPFASEGKEPAKEIPLDVTKTVQKVGTVYRRTGEELNLYVAVAAVSPKEDWDWEFAHGIKSWAFIYWIDHQGMNNELYGAAGQWDPQGKVIDNRQVWWGQTDIFFLNWVNGVTVGFPIDDYEYFEDPGHYFGFVLGCQTRVDVVNLGTVKCSVTSGLLT